MSSVRPSASFYTFGCRLNQAETALIQNDFESNGYAVVPFGEKSDICVINSCTVTDNADARCRKMVRRLLRDHPDTYIAIVGCYAQTGYKELRQIEGIDMIVGTQAKMQVRELIGDGHKGPEPVVIRQKMTRSPFTVAINPRQLPTTRANLKMQDGCDFMCAFCIIPFARGRARSRAFWDLQREAQDLVAAGYREFVLTGVNLGTYAHEGKGFMDVIEMLLKVPGLDRLRISSIEPTTIPLELLDLMAIEEKLCSHLHIPLQSGSSRVLKDMRRLYDAPEYLQFIERAAQRIPDVLIGTDIIVGFPTESEDDFEESMAMLRESPLAYAHVFTYSERQGTASSRWATEVAPAEKKRRSKALHAISSEQKQTFYRRHIGTRHRVLLEEELASGDWLGFTDNYLRVRVPSQPGMFRNRFVNIKIDAVEGETAIGRLETIEQADSDSPMPQVQYS